ncbi:MAG: hypothetical protein COW85_05790 [Ignavibacteria bacterium CG22_combo_CG10-13_8_21_14_all_37_15]|nr:hypothetical protein [Ignavibacteria bacterium]NCS81681.1 hypothetical protein [Ignavibacteria bacterium]PIP78054.1 MAG: hypothetical protein COW85_05790 [Ignavibacteria bacterium CG22_combo_CG10-13_8_21_14_all_37_15]PIX94149.1 MAG: hypothetical protein COZ25_07030 [Ignavibacteria bacterium CG_4_10_14_3_um_filter_37_18]PJC59798.1 MAG: hypothetical protein CO025_05085 [Ignavibacteria bacterium CG_4_9_14_0_2_um_filter_37_13]
MLLKNILRSVLIVGLLLVFSSSSLYSIPSFARKYGLDCSACHNPIPRLNAYGFKFRAAGFRLPKEIGQNVSSENIGDYLAARIQERWDVGRSVNSAGTASSSNQFTLHEINLYPATGAFGTYLSAFNEITFPAGEIPQIENSYIKATFGDEDAFYTIKAGIFHAYEGYGASDRSLGNNKLLFITSTAASSVFAPWTDQVGIELGYAIDNTFIRATVFNGLNDNGDAAVGGAFKKTKGSPSYNSKDIQLFVNQILTKDGGGLSGYFYHGSVDLTSGATVYQNNYNRYAFYGSYPFQNILALAGYEKGQDQAFDATTSKVNGTYGSSGLFGELNYKIQDPFWIGVRFSQFDPTESVSNNSVSLITAMVHYSLQNGLYFVGEFNHQQTDLGANLNKKDDTFQLRIAFVY